MRKDNNKTSNSLAIQMYRPKTRTRSFSPVTGLSPCILEYRSVRLLRPEYLVAPCEIFAHRARNDPMAFLTATTNNNREHHTAHGGLPHILSLISQRHKRQEVSRLPRSEAFPTRAVVRDRYRLKVGPLLTPACYLFDIIVKKCYVRGRCCSSHQW